MSVFIYFNDSKQGNIPQEFTRKNRYNIDYDRVQLRMFKVPFVMHVCQ